MKALPYALALLAGGLIGWKLARWTRKAVRPMRDVLTDYASGLDCPVPYRFVSPEEAQPSDLLDRDAELCFGFSTTLLGAPCS